MAEAVKTVIDDAQELIAIFRSKLSSAKQNAVFDRMLKAHQEMSEVGNLGKNHRINEFTEYLQNIKDVEKYFSEFDLVDDNLLNVNNELVIDPKAFLQINEEDRNRMLMLLKDLEKRRISWANFVKEIGVIQRNNRIVFERERQFTVNELQKCFGVSDLSEARIGDTKIFENLKSYEIDRLHNFWKQAGKHHNPDCMKVAIEMGRRMCCSNITEFVAAAEFAIRVLDSKMSSLRKENSNPGKGVKARDFYMEKLACEFLSDRKSPQYSEVIVNSF